ncbi:ATP-binding protein [Pelagibacterium montanilacus]|uniref:ATP-binding protein n=1 Tax=Pelagibacterium montanilacus TaxID=2185280 RepID=UPI000F8EB030|nr:ATP-binding protein [Pelagibacterium montanilacus]
MKFIGRERELGLLKAEIDLARPSLVIAYGRRRIGKSWLLKQAADGRPNIYFQATIASSAQNLETFKAVAALAVGDSELLAGLGTWESVFHYLAEAAKKQPGLVVIFDEFPYLLADDKSLPSVLQRFWDTDAAAAGNLKLILCGSAISQMEDLLAEKNPLYGRKTMSIDVKQLSLREAAEFFPDYSAEAIIETYAVFGGVPHYLAQCDPSKDLRGNIIDLLLTETGGLVNEPEFLMRSEFEKPRTYAAILAAIADGCDGAGAIADRIKAKTSDISPYVARLIRLDLITSEKSLDADDRGRNRRLRLNDQLLAFWYRFLPRYLGAINSGHGKKLFDSIIVHELPEFMGGAFEKICRDYARLHLEEQTGVPAAEVGSIWGHRDMDVDVAGMLLNGEAFFGEAKWRERRVDMAIIEKLKEAPEKSGYGGTDGHHFLLFSKTGFKEEVQQIVDASVHLIDPELLVYGPDRGYRHNFRGPK